jgi:hypothetical protein
MSVKKIVLGVLAALAVLIGGILLVAALQPTDFLVTRSASMAAPPARVFQQVNSFHAWEAWSPWAKLDLNAKAFFEGPESGVGAQFTWNDLLGEALESLKMSVHSAPGGHANPQAESVYDAMNRAGLLGCLKGPPDLSSNPAYLEGFGGHGR